MRNGRGGHLNKRSLESRELVTFTPYSRLSSARGAWTSGSAIQRRVYEPDRAPRNVGGRRRADRTSCADLRSGQEMEPRRATTVWRRRDPRGPDTRARPERECARRAIRSVDQGRTSRSNDSAGGAALPTRAHGVCRALPFGTESPRTRQPADHGDTRGRRDRPRASALAPRRPAELLRACCVIGASAEMWNSTASQPPCPVAVWGRDSFLAHAATTSQAVSIDGCGPRNHPNPKKNRMNTRIVRPEVRLWGQRGRLIRSPKISMNSHDSLCSWPLSLPPS